MEEKPYGFIYITTNKINGVKYIGQKSYQTNNWKNYLGSGIHLKNAINKYGSENFERKIIEECFSKEELDKREIYWIDFYNAVNSENFYNIAKGGDGGNVIAGFSDERRNELKELHSKLSMEYVPSCEDGWSSKLNNNQVLEIIDRLNSSERIKDIAKDYNVSYSTISDILHKRTWKELTNNIAIKHDYSKRYYKGANKKPIIQYDLDGNFIAKYNSAREAEKETGIGFRMISRVCKGERPCTHGFIFKFEN